MIFQEVAVNREKKNGDWSQVWAKLWGGRSLTRAPPTAVLTWQALAHTDTWWIDTDTYISRILLIPFAAQFPLQITDIVSILPVKI